MSQPFTENMRFDHPITPDDWVLEIGAHKGFDTRLYASKYGCTVVAYEPVKEFYQELGKLVPEFRVIPMNYAIGAGEGTLDLGVQGDRSGIACGSEQREEVRVVPICDVIASWSHRLDRFPALVSLNAEGMEWQILSALLAGGQHKHIPRIQYQPHTVVVGYENSRTLVRAALTKTHEPLWDLPDGYDIVWEGWRLKDK